jgi:arsenical pump membrane protein
MSDLTIFITICTFVFSMIFIFWRPKGLNEAIPATLGAIVVILSGSVTFTDLQTISTTVGGAAITIISTIIMAIVFESFGFFQWIAEYIYSKSLGSGVRLFWYVILLCFGMTLFFNNDGSILITTPILLLLLERFELKPHQKIPYLLSGALVATASSAPIGVSNIVNLISLKIVGMSLYLYTAMLFVPAILGLLVMVMLLFVYFYNDFPPLLAKAKQGSRITIRSHPLKEPLVSRDSSDTRSSPKYNQAKFMRNLFLYVLAVRLSLFVASYFGIPVELAAVCGSILLLIWRWYVLRIGPSDIVKKTPWHILVFAFGMYVIIFGLHKIGLTSYLIFYLKPYVSTSLFHASIFMGVLVSIMSSLFNNHPALMIGTLTITNMGLNPTLLKTAYLANVIGSDIGSLLLPIGTLATLIWMYKLKLAHVKIKWSSYVKVTLLVIPITVTVTLLLLYLWIRFVF